MRYNEHDFWEHVVRRLHYKLVGWPPSTPFTNLSNLKGGRRPVEELLQLWSKGTLTFMHRACRCDLKSHRNPLTASGKPRRCRHRGAITPLYVHEAVDARMDTEIEEVEAEAGGRRVAQGELAEDPIGDADGW
ncbi:uncharacterized protein B0H18DRAFT_1006863 [Fomitopsis serialis]|nr:uncharacterized protein B0H18DRAFT_1006863 [Neoantrodia serialis]KAH9926187.1 hypothetical protein B0H18DRAFT_1006863 [Neoantrodia serialis]